MLEFYEPNFKKGDIIEFCGETYEVIDNYGSNGTVRENYTNGIIISNFKWEFEGEKCKLV